MVKALLEHSFFYSIMRALVLPVRKNFDRKVIEHSSHVLISLESNHCLALPFSEYGNKRSRIISLGMSLKEMVASFYKKFWR
jgi:hypothetical protein